MIHLKVLGLSSSNISTDKIKFLDELVKRHYIDGGFGLDITFTHSLERLRKKGYHAPTALFIPSLHVILLNLHVAHFDFGQTIEDFLHELQHANQRAWFYNTEQSFLKDMGLDDLFRKTISFDELVEYCNVIFDYKDNPLEKDARRYARKHFAEEITRYQHRRR